MSPPKRVVCLLFMKFVAAVFCLVWAARCFLLVVVRLLDSSSDGNLTYRPKSRNLAPALRVNQFKGDCESGLLVEFFFEFPQ